MESDADEPSLDLVEGGASGRIRRGGPNLNRLLQSLEELENGRCGRADAVAVVMPVIDHFRKWRRQMAAVPAAHLQELPDLARMLEDYVPLAARLEQELEAYRASLEASDVVVARARLQSIVQDMYLLDDLHLHYQSLGY